MYVFMSGIFVAPIQKGVAKVVGLVLVAPRHPLQVKEELHIGDHGKPVHLIASVEEARHYCGMQRIALPSPSTGNRHGRLSGIRSMYAIRISHSIDE